MKLWQNSPGRETFCSVETEQKRYTFFIPGRPVPWARTRMNRGGHFFTPNRQRIYKLSLGSFFSQKVREPLEGPLAVTLRVQLVRPRTNKTLLPITRNTSDVDNWAKMVLDAGNGLLWKDDCQIAVLEVSKVWVADEDGEGVFIQVFSIRDEDLIESEEVVTETIQ